MHLETARGGLDRWIVAIVVGIGSGNGCLYRSVPVIV